MTEAFREHLGDSSIPYLQYLASPFYVNSPFYPFIKRLEWTAGIVRTDTEAQKLDKLEGILQGSAENKREDAPLLAALLSIPFDERYPRLQINELVQKQRTMEVLEEQLVLLSSRGPVLVVFEDAHWIDRTSLELMNKIIRRVADLPVMIIVTHRPEFIPPWLDLGHVTVLKLNQLGPKPGGRPHSQSGRRQDAARGNQRADRRQVRRCPAICRGNHAGNFGIRRSGAGRRALRLAAVDSRLHHSIDVAGLADRASGSPRLGQGGGAHGVDHGQRVFLRADRGDIAGASGDAAGGP